MFFGDRFDTQGSLTCRDHADSFRERCESNVPIELFAFDAPHHEGDVVAAVRIPLDGIAPKRCDAEPLARFQVVQLNFGGLGREFDPFRLALSPFFLSRQLALAGLG